MTKYMSWMGHPAEGELDTVADAWATWWLHIES
jgi:hypothetical protein